MKVLVVDDIGIVRYYLEQALKEHGVLAIAAGSGHQALEILAQDNAVKVVLTDLMMPGMDGLELFKASRKIDRFDDNGPLPPPQFILMTALRPSASTPRKERNLLQQATDLGFVDVLLKPVDIDHLLRTLREIEAAEHAPPAAKRTEPVQVDDLLQRLAGVEAAIGIAAERRDRGAVLELQSKLGQVQQRLTSLVELAANAIAELDRASVPPAAETDPLLDSLQSTLASLQDATSSMRNDGERESAMAVCKQLEARAQELRERLKQQ